VEGANKEEPYPYRISGIDVWRKRSRGSSTHELASCEKGACAKARLWSHGDVRLAPGVKLRRVGFHEGPVDSFKGFQQEPEEPFRLRRRSIQRPGGRRTLLR
jgi:hypothetical protein